jgi:hypothetical protein
MNTEHGTLNIVEALYNGLSNITEPEYQFLILGFREKKMLYEISLTKHIIGINIIYKYVHNSVKVSIKLCNL